MKRFWLFANCYLLSALFAICYLPIALFAQTTQTGSDYIGKRVQLTLSNAPQPVTNASVFVSGNPGPATYYYWIVTQTSVGASSPAGPFQVINAPNVLSGSNFIQISWATVPGATYDVLRTSNTGPPFGACSCAVATGVTSNSVSDQANLTLAYTVNTLDPSTQTVTLQNLNGTLGLPALAVSGAITSQTHDGIRFADSFPGTGATQINNAENDCGTTNCLVIVPATVAPGAGQNRATKDNLFVVDLRAPANAQQQDTDLILNVPAATNANIRSKALLVDTFTPSNVLPATGGSATYYVKTTVEGALLGTYNTIEAGNDTITVDTGVTGTGSVFAGRESECFVSGTVANTIPSCRAGTFNVGDVGPGNITNAVAVQAQAAIVTSTGTITNAIGLLAEKQTVGTSKNLGILNQGQSEFDDLIGVGTTPSAGVSLFIQPSGSVFGATQIGIQSVPITSGGATGAGIGISTRADIFGGAITQALNVGLRVETPSLNGNTVTEWDGVLINPGPTAGTKCSLKVSGATSGAACVNAPATGGVLNTLPSTAGTLTVTVGSGTVTTAGTAVPNGTCQAQTTITVTGATATDVAACSLNAAAPATWQTGIFLAVPEVTSNAVTVRLCNGTAASMTPAAATVRCSVTR